MIDFWKKLWRLIRPHKVRFFFGVLFGVLSGLAEPLVLVVVAFVVGVVFFDAKDSGVKKAVESLNSFSPKLAHIFQNAQQAVASHVATSRLSLLLLVSLVPMVMLWRGICNYLNNYLISWVAIRGICTLRARLFEHLMNLPLGFLSKFSTGELMSRIGDVGMLQNMLGNAAVTLIREPVNMLTLVYIAFRTSGKLSAIALVTFPFCAIPIVIYNKKIRRAGAAIQTELANLNRVVHECFTGNRIIKGYTLENAMMERFLRLQKQFISQYMRAVRSTEAPGPLIEVLGATGIALLIFYVAGSTTLVQFGIFVGSIIMIYRPVKAIIRVISQLHQARAATDRVFELLATQSNLPEPAQPVALQAAGADVVFDNVSFAYEEKPVLHGINLRVPAGRMVALVGFSGAGKSTVTNLLLRFYDPTQGAVLIGGVDLRHVATRDLRSQIAVATQEVILFNDTIRQNIAYGRPGASFEEIQAAARHAFAEEFILGKPKGYDSVVGEKGTNLSGGERQRIAIARAILKNAPILILDEATGSLDNESERIVQAALDELMKNRTTICIAHRLSTIRHADQIVAMEQGRIAEMGKHEELLAKGGVYAKLHALGFRDPGGSKG